MTRSSKLGTAGALLLASIFVPPYQNWREPVSFASAVISCVLAYLASQTGSKWWLAIPSIVIAGFAAGVYLAIHSY
jgi:hypothetical protein